MAGALATATVIAGTAAHAQQAPRPLPVDFLLAAPTLAASGAPSFSPDGSALAYTVIHNGKESAFTRPRAGRAGVPWYAVGGEIWVTSLAAGESRSITVGRGDNWSPSWSPDGRRIAFLSNRCGGASDGHARLWTWDRESGRLRQASDQPVMDSWGRLGQIEWLADRRRVVVKAYPEGMSPAAYAQTTGVGRRPPAGTGMTARVYRFDPNERGTTPVPGATNLAALSGDLTLIDVETGRVERVSGTGRIGSYALSPDRRTLAWTSINGFARPGSHQILADIVVHDLGAGGSRRIARDIPLAHAYPNFPMLSWSPTSRAIAYRTNGVGIRDEVWVVDLAGGAPRLVAEGPILEEPHQDERPLWDPAGRQLLFTRAGDVWRAEAAGQGAKLLVASPERSLRLIARGSGKVWSADGGHSLMAFTLARSNKRAGLARVDLTSGRLTQLLEEEKWYDIALAKAPMVAPDGSKLVFVAEDPKSQQNLWLARGDGALPLVQVTRIGGELSGFGGGPAELIEWRGLDGDTLRGALLYPAGYRRGTRYPLIVRVYGGSAVSDDVYRFGHSSTAVDNVRLFTSRGYALLLADSKLRMGTPMLDLLKTVMPGVDRAVELGVADPERIGIMGHSYGGYSTLALIAQSRRFSAAVMRAGMGDLNSAYGQLGSDGSNYLLPWAEEGQGRMGGTPWEFRERYIENSPAFYLDRVETPLLIIQGETDAAPFLADQVFTGLRRLGRPVEYARYAGEGHSEALWSRANQMDYLNRMLAWFARHLMKR